MTVGRITTSVNPPLNRLWGLVFAGLSYFLLAWAMIALTSQGSGVATVWPGNAVLLALMLHRPRSHWPELLLAAFIGNAFANMLTRGTMLGPVLFGVANMAEVLIVAMALYSSVQRVGLLHLPIHLKNFLIWAGLVGPLASAACGAATVWALFGKPFWMSLLTWYLADSLGLLVFAPFMFAVFSGKLAYYFREKSPAERWEAIGLLALVAVIAAFALSRHYPILFLVYTPVILITFRLGWMGAKIAVMIVAIMGGIFIMGDVGPIPMLFTDRLVQAFCFQLFLAIMLLTTYPIAANLTARKRLMRNLEESEGSLRLLASQSPILLLSFDAEGECRKALGAADSLLGRDADSLVGRSLTEIRTPGYAKLRGAHERALKDVGSVQVIEFQSTDGNGKWFEATFRAALAGRDGRHGTLATLQDVTGRKHQELHLTRSATTDSLTGLLNRAGFLARLEQALRDAEDCALSLAMIDVDRFKLINDNSGHMAGDQVLKEIADRIAAEVRSSDAIGRLGGDEFVLLLETSDWEKAQEICGRVVEAIDGTDIVLPTGGTLKAAISCGVARYRSGLSAEELIHEADLALYEAKRLGRNRMVSSGGDATAIPCPS